MKKFLLPHLICPACLPAEHSLQAEVRHQTADDLINGDLLCRKCLQRFPVRDGLATLVPDQAAPVSAARLRYDDDDFTNRYLWSHFGDLAGCTEAGTPYAIWSACLTAGIGGALDCGCAVGRLTFELAAGNSWAVGCDTSPAFIRKARQLAQQRRATFSLPLEGQLREVFKLELPERLPSDNVEFIIADAMALPFARATFRSVTSLNVLDRISYPLAHLYETSRVSLTSGASLLCADPYSWSVIYTPEERWLGGTINGAYPGRGKDNVARLLEGKDNIITPPWTIARQGNVPWLLRSHAHHQEQITSQFLLACR